MNGNIVKNIANEIASGFDGLGKWFDVDEFLMRYVPANNGWNIQQNLEHISLTNHYLLILVKKGTAKAIDLSAKKHFCGFPEGYEIDWLKLEAIGIHKSFKWIRPEHMEPTGNISLDDIQNRLNVQKSECLSCLEKLQNGEGVLYKTMMSVNGLGKIDVYHYILFLMQHIKRHTAQMEKIKLEFDQL